MQADCFDRYYNGFMLGFVAVQTVLDHYMHIISIQPGLGTQYTVYLMQY